MGNLDDIMNIDALGLLSDVSVLRFTEVTDIEPTGLSGTTTAWITDKSGERMFKENRSTEYFMSTVRELERKFSYAKQYPEEWKFLDMKTARIEVHHNE